MSNTSGQKKAIFEFAAIAVIIVLLLVLVKPYECRARYKMMMMHHDGKITSMVFTNIPEELQQAYPDGTAVDMHFEVNFGPSIKNVKIIRFCDKYKKYPEGK
jgi:hypothetical protein